MQPPSIDKPPVFTHRHEIPPDDKRLLGKFKTITDTVQKAFQNSTMASGLKQLNPKCWGSGKKQNSQSFELIIGDEKIAFPEDTKTLLSQASPFFKAFFESNFREKQSGVFKINEVRPAELKHIIKLLRKGKFHTKEITLEELIGLLVAIDRFQLHPIAPLVLLTLARAIEQLKNTEEHEQLVHAIHAALKATTFYGNLIVQKAIDGYFFKAAGNLQSFEDLLNYTKAKGEKLLSLLIDSSICVTDEQLAKLIGNCPNLSSLVIKNGQLTNSGLRCLHRLFNLSKLHLNNCYELTDESLEFIKSLSYLTDLNLFGCRQLKDISVAFIAQLKKLQALSLSGCIHLTSAGFARLKELNQLRKLNLTNCSQLTDADLYSIKGLRHLTSLQFYNCYRLTDQGIAHLNSLTNLKKLSLANCINLTDEGLKSISGLGQLRVLDLYNCTQLTDEGMKCLKNMKNLRQVDLQGCEQISKIGINNLQDVQGRKLGIIVVCKQN